MVQMTEVLCVCYRQAREIVLKYEGRLTRTRGYQAAGADVSSTRVLSGNRMCLHVNELVSFREKTLFHIIEYIHQLTRPFFTLATA